MPAGGGCRTIGVMTTTHDTDDHNETAGIADPALRRLGRAGGVAALVEAATYAVGFVVLLAYLVPRGFLDAKDDPTEAVRFLVEHDAVLYAWNVVVYLVAATALAVLTLALHDRVRAVDPVTARLSAVFGIVWSTLLFGAGMIALVGQQTVVGLYATDPSQAASTWSALGAVRDGLGGGIELAGAIWVLLATRGATATRLVGRRTRVLGTGVAVAGLVTVLPGTDVAAGVFGLGFIAWYTIVGLALLRPRA